jgi:hypothetical protein
VSLPPSWPPCHCSWAAKQALLSWHQPGRLPNFLFCHKLAHPILVHNPNHGWARPPLCLHLVASVLARPLTCLVCLWPASLFYNRTELKVSLTPSFPPPCSLGVARVLTCLACLPSASLQPNQSQLKTSILAENPNYRWESCTPLWSW